MQPAGQAMQGVITEILRNAPLSPEKISLAWRMTVGAAMARVTHARLNSEGVLLVTATDEHWQKEVRRATRVILPRLSAMLGEGTVRRLEVTR